MRQAERLLQKKGMLDLPVDLEHLAKTHDIVVKPMGESNHGVSGMLVRHGNAFGILYDASIHNEGYQRFSIAHELGHYFVDGHLDHIPFDNGLHSSRADFVSDDQYEREADYFAAGLLMPTTLMRGVMRGHQDGLNSINAIQLSARTSMTASAIRYAGLTEIAAAVIISRNCKVDYCFISDDLKSLHGLSWLRKGTPVPTGTVTETLARKRIELRRGASFEDEIDIREWFGGTQSVQVLEEAVGLGNFDRVLTVLTCLDFPDENDEDKDEESDEAMEERWTPRFRR